MKHNRRIVTAALIPTLALGGISLGTAATTVLATASVATAAQPGPWSTPTALTGTTDGKTVVDVATTTDGTAVAAWYRWPEGTLDAELSIAVRPATSTAWAPAKVLGITKDGAESVVLTPASDGSMVVTWVADLGSTEVLRTSTLAKGSTAWSAPTTIATRASIGEMAFAHDAATGKSMAVWHESGSGQTSVLYVSERTGAGAWSAPKVLGGTSAYRPQVAFAPDGAVMVVWDEQAELGQTVTSIERPAGATEWTAPKPVSALYGGGAAHLSTGPDGTAALAWVKYTEGTDTMSAAIVTAVRSAGSGGWTADEPRPVSEFSAIQAPLVGPTGEVTLVWTEGVGTGEDNVIGVRTASRNPDGAWTEAKTLSTGYVPEQFDAAVGTDGTVQVGWAQNGTGDADRRFYTSARISGVWTAPKQLSSAGSMYAEGHVAVAPDGDATAVWAHENQLWAAGTGLTAPPLPPAPAKHRDYVGKDGFPDLYAQTASGALYVYRGNAGGTVSARVDGGTWPTTSTLVPFGDLDGDGCNDTLVRTSVGELYRYTPACGTAVTPTAPRTRIGASGWNAFDAFTYSGDFNGDKLPDLIARQISTGDLYLFAGTKSGGIVRVGKVGSGWKSLTIIGTGDLNGDRHGDLVARTSTGYLYRYLGTGRGTIGSGVKIGSGWGGMVNMIGIGDLTGDGKNDIVGRTTAGDLYRYAGTGTGTIGSGAKIGTGWKSFTSIK
ncbi:FG-GAP repeat domain-containing protein [Streptomyces sp. NPDC048604]|uniref:FG-GAP repeat domain-containing protein n=1 Tax=Streptomyces sp. NPDC048604 TaxID=3365578 RepID=UPI00371EF6D4